MTLDDIDKTGLIREAYRIEGISAAECRSIFVDWAIKLPDTVPAHEAIARLLDEYDDGATAHPMTDVLREGLQVPRQPKRRGGRTSRLSAE